MSLRVLVEEKAKKYNLAGLSNKKFLLKIVGGITVMVKVSDPDECFVIKFDENNYHFLDCNDYKPNVVIEGHYDVIKRLLNTLDVNYYKIAEKNGDIKISSRGIKGRLVISKIKKLLGL